MTDNERADVTLKDIQDEAMKCGVNLQDIWPDLEGKYNHYVKNRNKSNTGRNDSSSKGEFMKTAVIKSSSILQKHCADCDVELAKFISTGLEEAFCGCDNDHTFDNVRRALNDDERTKRQNVSAMARFTLLKILRELLYTTITCFLCHDRRAGKDCANIKHPNTADKCEKEYPEVKEVVPLSKVTSGGAKGELFLKKGTDKYTYEQAKKTYEASSGGMKLEDNTIWTEPDYDNASQGERTTLLKKTFDDTLKRKAGKCACCGLSIRNLPVKVFQGFDLHHIDELLKRYDPANMLGFSIQNKVREFRETVLLCKACHSSITHDVDSLKEFMAMLRREGVIDKDGSIIH